MAVDRAARNKNIAIQAIDLARSFADMTPDPAQTAVALEEFHARWEAEGVWWTRPRPMAFDFDDWISAADMAVIADVGPNTVRMWCRRGHITAGCAPDGSPLYNVGEVLRYQARRERGG
ncbi:hypothetical protein [Mycolicibacterium fortuitum]|uniref:hypothetical protein n=1 Tax=Mycolicibacterium fortuitum TaxID=1766 RepID=UPI002639C191|nr:hypothetical protein [Mycolicibacterium fortuitum]